MDWIDLKPIGSPSPFKPSVIFITEHHNHDNNYSNDYILIKNEKQHSGTSILINKNDIVNKKIKFKLIEKSRDGRAIIIKLYLGKNLKYL